MAHIAQVIHEALGRMRHLLPSKQYVKVPGSILAPPQSRWCGAEFKDDTFYVKSAEGEAHRLMNGLQCTNTSRVLDVGCGQGRLPIGMLRVIGEMNYLGLDVHQPSIEWCKRYIERDYPSFQFAHINVYNERYNKHGRKIERGFRFALEPESVDSRVSVLRVFAYHRRGYPSLPQRFCTYSCEQREDILHHVCGGGRAQYVHKSRELSCSMLWPAAYCAIQQKLFVFSP